MNDFGGMMSGSWGRPSGATNFSLCFEHEGGSLRDPLILLHRSNRTQVLSR